MTEQDKAQYRKGPALVASSTKKKQGRAVDTGNLTSAQVSEWLFYRGISDQVQEAEEHSESEEKLDIDRSDDLHSVAEVMLRKSTDQVLTILALEHDTEDFVTIITDAVRTDIENSASTELRDYCLAVHESWVISYIATIQYTQERNTTPQVSRTPSSSMTANLQTMTPSLQSSSMTPSLQTGVQAAAPSRSQSNRTAPPRTPYREQKKKPKQTK